MSWNNVRPYFNSILEAQGYREWAEGFAVDTIPDTVLDKSFHVGLGPMEGIRQNQLDQETEVNVVLRTYYKGYRSSQEAIDTAVSESETIMKQLVKVADVGGRVSTAGLVNVTFNEVAIDPIDASNDNAVVVTAGYTVRVVIPVNE